YVAEEEKKKSLNPSIPIRAFPTEEVAAGVVAEVRSFNPSIPIRAFPTKAVLGYLNRTWTEKFQSLHTDQGFFRRRSPPISVSQSQRSRVSIPPCRSGLFPTPTATTSGCGSSRCRQESFNPSIPIRAFPTLATLLPWQLPCGKKSFNPSIPIRAFPTGDVCPIVRSKITSVSIPP